MKIGFICTGNSVRSQIAEAYAKHFTKLYGKNIKIYSAGIKPKGYIHPLAIKVLEEDQIDHTGQHSKSLEEIPYYDLDLVIILCGDADENCPSIPNIKRQHLELFDPIKHEVIEFFRKVRDEIKMKIENLIRNILRHEF